MPATSKVVVFETWGKGLRVAIRVKDIVSISETEFHGSRTQACSIYIRGDNEPFTVIGSFEQIAKKIGVEL